MPMQQITVQERTLQTIQTNAAKAISNLEAATQIDLTPGAQSQTATTPPFTGGNILSGVTLTTGQDNPISHGLARTPRAWVIIDQNANAAVWRASWNSTQITLETSASCIVSLWVA